MKHRIILTASALVLAVAAVRADAPNDAAPHVVAARRVVDAVTAAARKNATSARPLKGDALTDLYVRVAAAEAAKLPPARAPFAFLTALGIALDDSTLVRDNPVFGAICRRVESAAARKARLAVLGSPTVRGRRDWCQHFAVSCMLTALTGPAAAEGVGLLKECSDMRPGGSGFSFADLSADLAGVAFAVRVKQGRLSLDKLATGFTVNDHVPDAAGISDGLTATEFRKQFGWFGDARYRAEVGRLRKRIAELPGQRGS